jgi:2-dehydro-3-deoxygalactonokinase
LGDYPVVMAGMVGSSIGWSMVPYATLPVDVSALARGAQRVADRAWIVPGICRIGPAAAGGEGPAKTLRGDVMRGEEVQFLGAQLAGLVGPEALLCQPGTHCKWAWIEHGVLTRFVTAMTGELFALLRGGGSLMGVSLDGPLPTAPLAPDGAFLRGVAEGARRDLAASLFRLRADSCWACVPKAKVRPLPAAC